MSHGHSTALAANPLAEVGLDEFARRIRTGETTIRATVESYLARIAALNPVLEAFVHVADDQAIGVAEHLDELLANRTDLGPLMGVPIAIKDIFAVAGMPTGAGSNLDVTDSIGVEGGFVKTLKDAGCVILGKTRTIEFAAGAQNLIHPTPWNPRDYRTKMTPGGSSSGSAVAVAAGLCGFAVGSDTGGSVRLPAAFCGVFGFKPSRHNWPLDGVLPLCPAMDTIGLLTASAGDAQLIYTALARGTEEQFPALRGVRLGMPTPECIGETDTSIAAYYEAALRMLEQHGASVVEVDWPTHQERLEIDEIFARVVSTDLMVTIGSARFQENHALIDPVAVARMTGAEGLPAIEYVRLQRRRRELASKAVGRMRGLDAVITPTSPIKPRPLSEVRTLNDALNFGSRSLACTRPINVYDLCAASLPLDVLEGGPATIGLQLICGSGEDRRLLALAGAIEARIGVVRRCDMTVFAKTAFR